jgi:hypothetical protein
MFARASETANIELALRRLASLGVPSLRLRFTAAGGALPYSPCIRRQRPDTEASHFELAVLHQYGI